ncbi:MAG: lipid-A-disaccharide synthase [Bacteroidetes bacterium B1(2017)]|nr:MAG: lipid-A-disaccharide synthase [Bacteroidetes bacterium B1(2017)]
MKYFLIAGEASGDMLGASLMEGIKAQDPSAQFQFWGGDLMQAQYPGLLQHYKEINIMGFVEVLLKIRTIRANFDRCKKQIMAFAPDVLILVDYPGFNMRMAAFGKENKIKTCYFIAPKIWAWNEKRGKKLEKYVDLLLLIFPFEQSYFKKWKVNTVYIGNPMYNQLMAFVPQANFREQNGLNQKPIIALLPGSRKQEVMRMLPNMVSLAALYPNYQFVIAGSPGLEANFYTPYLSENVTLIFNATRDILAASTASVVCSGTASLETAFMNVPQVVAYAAQPITYAIGKMVVKVQYASLVNLNLGREAVKELIQNDYTIENLQHEFEAILPKGYKHQLVQASYKELFTLFSDKDASQMAALEIKKLLQA